VIKAIIEALYSRRDRNGNCYFAFRYVDVATGKTVSGSISGGESNIRAIGRAMGFESNEFHFNCHELPIREFNRVTKTWAYAGCTPEDLAKYVRNCLLTAECTCKALDWIRRTTGVQDYKCPVHEAQS
jgi:hypothetical protein